jgi:hypothetical protein
MKYSDEFERAPKFILIWILILVGFFAGMAAIISASINY